MKIQKTAYQNTEDLNMKTYIVTYFPVSYTHLIVIGEGLGVTVDYKCEAWMTAEDVEQYCSVTMLPAFLKEAQKLSLIHI